MQELKHGELSQMYPKVVKELQEKYDDNIKGVVVEITEIGGIIKLSFDNNDLYLTPEQAVDLMRELRRAVVKISPQALRQKVKR